MPHSPSLIRGGWFARDLVGFQAAPAAGVVDFSGVDEEIRVAVGTNNPTGAFSVAVICRFDVLGQWHSLIAGHDSGGTAQWQLELSTANNWSVGTSATTSAVYAPTVGNWYLAVFSKPAGTGAMSARITDLTAATNSGLLALGGVVDAATTAGGTIRFGEWQDVDDFNGQLALAALWTGTALTGTQMATLTADANTWAALSPTGLWQFTGNTSADLQDRGTGGSNFTLANGTRVLTGIDPPGWVPLGATGPASLSRTASDTVTVSDAATPVGARPRTAADTVTVSDTAARTGTRARTAADTVAVSDTAARTLPRARTAADTVTVTDTAAGLGARARTAADTVTVSDTSAGQAGRSRTATDTVTITDAGAARAAIARARTASDTVTVSDTATAPGARARTAADTVAVSDSAVGQAGRSRTAADSVTVTDTVARAVGRPRAAADTVTVNDTAAAAVGRAVAASDTVTVSDASGATRAAARSAADVVTVTDTAGVKPTIRATATGTSSGSATVTVTRPAGLSTGDVLVAFPAFRGVGAASSVNVVSGWTRLDTRARNNGGPTGLFVRQITDIATEAASYSFVANATASSGSQGLVELVALANASVPADFTAVLGSTADVVHSAPAVTDSTGSPDTIALRFLTTAAAVNTPTYGYTWDPPEAELIDTASTTGTTAGRIVSSVATNTASGPWGAATATWGEGIARSWVGYSLAAPPVAGRVSLSRTAADTVAVSDTATRTGTRARTASDTVAVSDAAARVVARARAASDAVVLADVSGATGTRLRTGADTVPVTDSAAGIFAPGVTGAARTATDTVVVTDLAARPGFARLRTATDSVTVGDSAAAPVGRTRTAGDTWAVTDSTLLGVGWRRTVADVVAVTDTVLVTRGLTEPWNRNLPGGHVADGHPGGIDRGAPGIAVGGWPGAPAGARTGRVAAGQTGSLIRTAAPAGTL